MKKALKIFLKILASLFGLLVLGVIIIIVVDAQQTKYLDMAHLDSELGDRFIIKNVHIIPMHSDTILMDKMVLIDEGIIESIGDEINEDLPLMDGQGQYLTPGLIDMHVHIWDRYELGLYLANGVTAIRNLWGMPMHLRIKADIQEDKIIAPTFWTTGPKLTGAEFIGDDNLNLYSPEEATEKVKSFKDRGYDMIKTYYGMDRDVFDAVVQQAEISEMEIVAHPSQKVPFSYHTHPQIKSIEHAEEIVQQPLQFNLDTLQLQSIIDTIAESDHTRYCPTIIVFYNIYRMMMDDDILDSTDLRYINPMIREVDSNAQFQRWFNAKQNDPEVIDRIKNQHDFHLEIVSRLHASGVPIVCGTDSGIGVTLPGFSMHQELAFYREAGLSNYEVLQTATYNAAQTHDFMKNLGSIEEGKMANLLLLKNNPLDDLQALEAPSTVIVNGKVLDRATLNSFTEKAGKRRNRLASMIRYAENLLIERYL